MENSARRAARAGRALKKSGKNKRRGGGGNYGARYKPPKAGERLTPILLFRGLYKVPLRLPDGTTRTDEMDYDIVCEHYSKVANTGTTCSAGLVEDGDGFIMEGSEPCVPCFYWKENSDKGLSPRKMHIINGVLLADFHLVDSDREIKKDGRGTGEYYKDYVECLGRRCMHCKNGVESTFGRAVFMPLGNNFIQQLADFDLITLASECLCGGTLEPVGFVCPHCDREFVDLEKTAVTDEELQELREKEFRCKHCGKVDYMEEVPVCNQCQDPRPLTMWNTVMELYRSGEGVNTSLMVKKYRPVTEEELEQVKDLMVPADTSRLYKPISPAEQAKRFKLTLPDAYKGGGDGGGKGSSRWED